MRHRLAVMILVTLLIWTVGAWIAHQAWGQESFVQSAVAMLLCLVPAVGTLTLALALRSRSQGEQMLAMLGGVGIRMFVVLGTGLGLYFLVPALRSDAYWIWLLIFYLITLALEVGLTVLPSPSEAGRGVERVIT